VSFFYDNHKLGRMFWDPVLLDGARDNFDNSEPKRLLKRD
jgi:hypothetical protein